MEFFTEDFFSLSSLFTLFMLIMLQAVLGFDNLLYISIESKRVAEEEQSKVRKLGIGLAIGLRILLLLVMMYAFEKLELPFIRIHQEGILDIDMNVHAFVLLAGGIFILYTAVKEIFHMLAAHDLEDHVEDKPKRSVAMAVTWIVLMNLVFSFDSILSAIALTHNFIIMATAIVLSGLMMIYLADRVSEFLKKNRMYEVLGLFILFIVGIMLISEGGEDSHLILFEHEIKKMEKSTFYFVLAILVIVDVVQSRYQKKLLAEAELKRAEAEEAK